MSKKKKKNNFTEDVDVTFNMPMREDLIEDITPEEVKESEYESFLKRFIKSKRDFYFMMYFFVAMNLLICASTLYKSSELVKANSKAIEVYQAKIEELESSYKVNNKNLETIYTDKINELEDTISDKDKKIETLQNALNATDMNSQELPYCPLCGGDMEIRFLGDEVYLGCNECNLSTGMEKTVAEVLDKFNRRED